MIIKLRKYQRFLNNYIYSSYKDGGMGISSMKDFDNTFTIHRRADLLKTECSSKYKEEI
jgi:hypothetical protein